MRVETRRCCLTGRAIRISRHEDALSTIEMIATDPDPRLASVVRDYTGYRERCAAPVRRRELPGTSVVLIFDFGPTLRFPGTDSAPMRRFPGGFVAGLSQAPVDTATSGAQSGLHVNLTPLGARRLLGVPMAELADRIVGVDDAFGAAGVTLTEILRDTRSWPRRFALLDRAIERRLADTDPTPRLAATAWTRLAQSAGRIPVEALAAELECSRKHLATVFRDQIGLSPKRIARILRFRHAIGLFDRGECTAWTDVAHASGYADQAHFIHDFRRFSGATPSEFLKRRRPFEDATLDG